MHVKSFSVANIVGSPHSVDEGGSGHDASCIAQQHLKQVELFEGKSHYRPLDADLVPLDVHPYPALLENIGGNFYFGAATTSHSADARDQFSVAKRFGDVVVGSELQPDNLVDLRISSRHHDDPDIAALA